MSATASHVCHVGLRRRLVPTAILQQLCMRSPVKQLARSRCLETVSGGVHAHDDPFNLVAGDLV
jgi:hypothetical protein